MRPACNDIGESVRKKLRPNNLSFLSPSLLVSSICLLFVIALGVGLIWVRKAPSVDAFAPNDHHAALARDKARDIFGLEDPIVVAFVAPNGETIYTPTRLGSISSFTDDVDNISGILRGKVVSLTTESAINSERGDLLVDPIWDGGGDARAHEAEAMLMLVGALATENGPLHRSSLLLMMQVIDQMRLNMGADIFWGDDDEIFGQFNEKSRLSVQMKFSM